MARPDEGMKVLEERRFAVGAMAGDQEAVRAIWHAHRRWVAAILLAHKPREADLEDLLQEVAMTLVRQVHTLNDPAAVRPWLRAVALNAARTHGRRQKLTRKMFAPTGMQPSERSEAAREVDTGRTDAREEGRRALRIARGLPAEYGEPLILRAVRGLSYKQIADIMGVPVTTIETRLARARRMVREEMLREEEGTTAGRIGPPGVPATSTDDSAESREEPL
ncbi:MAG TPA: RNA polymerase sigma factor [Phycisphaerales bacterium]|nr:RNA polymerase sigma factor [Phycisphaerales bacterium]